MSNKFSSLMLATALILAPQAAFAKDWIQSVSVKSDGIDVVPIQVRAGATKFSSVKPQNHKFTLRIRAKAKSGKRIVAAKVGSGKLREVKRTFAFKVPTTKIHWKGSSAVDRCNKLLNA